MMDKPKMFMFNILFYSAFFLMVFPIFVAWWTVDFTERKFGKFMPSNWSASREMNYNMDLVNHAFKGIIIGMLAGCLYALPLAWFSYQPNLIWWLAVIAGIIGGAYSSTMGNKGSLCPKCKRLHSVHWVEAKYDAHPNRSFSCEVCGHSWEEDDLS